MARSTNNSGRTRSAAHANTGAALLEPPAPPSARESSLADQAYFLEALPIAVVAMDTAHTIHYINQYAADVAGLPREECLGKKFWDVLYDSDACRHETCAAGEAVRTGRINTGETHLKVRGRDWPVRVICSPRHDRQGRTIGCFQVMYEADKEIEVSGEILRLVKAAESGELDRRGDTGRFTGNYRTLVDGINTLLDTLIRPLHVAADYVDKISRGQIPPPITDHYQGDFNTLKNNLNHCIENINHLVADAGILVEAAVAGRLDTRADSSRHEGDYRKIVDGVNRTLDAVIEPVKESSQVLARIAAADLTARVQGNYQGDHARLKDDINRMAADLHDSIRSFAQSAQTVAASSEELTAVSHQMAGNAEETATQANVVSAASEQVSRNVSTVASGAEQMQASIREIAKNSNEAARVAKNAVNVAHSTNETVTKLGESSQEIGNVIKVITSIAQQTNLLALNATIEAARAGEAGKGFAVVANEVKELAKQTAKATEEIGQKIEAIQADTKGAVSAIAEIGTIINQINDISNSIASAVEEQTVTTNEIGRNVNEAARGTGDIAKNISGVAVAAKNTTQGAGDTQRAAQELSRMAAQLQSVVSKYTF